MRLTLNFGRRSVELTARDEDLLRLDPPPPVTPLAPDDPASVLRAALDAPFRYAPLRLALTPDDQVTVVLDEGLPHLVALLSALLGHILSAGVAPEAVTVLVPPGAGRQGWLDDLPDEYQDVRVEVHDPADRRRLAYLMSTPGGRRVYLNRTAVEAGLTVVLSGVGYDSLLGYGGGPGALFPALSDAETLTDLAGQLSFDGPGPRPRPALADADAAAAELNPFLVQVIEDAGEGIARVVCGLAETATDARRAQDARWRARVPQRADTVVATLTGDPARHDFAAIARAFACGARMVNPEGRVVVLTDAAFDLPPAASLLQQFDDPEAARDALVRDRPAGYAAGYLWASAAQRASLFLVSGLEGEVVEELFAAPLDRPEFAQRLLDAPGPCLVVPDAHKMLVEVAGRAR